MGISRDLVGIPSAAAFLHQRRLAILFLSHLELIEIVDLILKVMVLELDELILKVTGPQVGLRQLHQSVAHSSLFGAASPERKCMK